MSKHEQLYNMIVCEFINDTISIETFINKSIDCDVLLSHDEIVEFLKNENLYQYDAFNENHNFIMNEELIYDLFIYARVKLSCNMSKLFNVTINQFEDVLFDVLELTHFEIKFNDKQMFMDFDLHTKQMQ